MRLVVLAALILAAPPPDLSGNWRGTWTDPSAGTSGRARLVVAARPELRLDGAFGCIGTIVLPVAMRGRRITGSGAKVACNRGLRWSLSGTFDGTACSGAMRLRLADGSRAILTIELRR